VARRAGEGKRDLNDPTTSLSRRFQSRIWFGRAVWTSGVSCDGARDDLVEPTDQEAEEYIQRKIERLPRWIGRSIGRLRRDGRLWLRLLVAILLILGGVFWFLPVLGIWMLPLGFILLASEVPPLKRWMVRSAKRIERRRSRTGRRP
jgi:hypothetical protein